MKPVVVRAITGFLELSSSDFDHDGNKESATLLAKKVRTCASFLKKVQHEFEQQGYIVQTLRLATNPFGEWLLLDGNKANDDEDHGKGDNEKSQPYQSSIIDRLKLLDTILAMNEISFCSLGPAMTIQEATSWCCQIVALSSRLSCSMNIKAGDVVAANAAANIILDISKLGSLSVDAPQHVKDGLGNFQFCAASNCQPFIPFFPAAKSVSSSSSSGKGGEALKFAIGLENGPVIQSILADTGSVGRIADHFSKQYSDMLLPLQDICNKVASNSENAAAEFLGIDTSLNPSLAANGSIAAALEALDEVEVFGGPGTTAATAQLTVALQSLPNIKLTGYCGVMLPVCEDQRLAELTLGGAKRKLRISDLLLISTVCGVGLDTIPLPGDCSVKAIASMILDVAGIAGRWNKSLSCRVLPVPGLHSGDMTRFDSPYLINAQVFSVD
ncbi:unnamed protein product [Cylindrotheca closterium]|uniref:DUF711 domain-containing protein n=1 Tax=Cylindrotheca closterium TaxID=2856 RepID=A0AAD2G8D9_9STRA|nr:unnamed protein product [Cylindrotheca closterium]